MENWAGNVDFNYKEIKYPTSESEIQKLVIKCATNNTKIRVIGSGHSFTKLCTTDSILVSLNAFEGLIAVDKEKLQATVRGGTKLKKLGQILFKEGLAMENLGDIDAQSIAGTISTGTHGTGTNFGTISTQVIRIKLINGKGDIVECSPTQELEIFKAAQLSLGALGIITEITLQCVPAYKLLVENRKEKVVDVLTNLEERKDKNRNFEFYWFPYTDYAWTKTTNIAEVGEPNKAHLGNYLSELFIENYTFQTLCEFARYFPSKTKMISRVIASSVPTVDKLSHSHEVYATMRLVKFTEMEYNIPADSYFDVIGEIMERVKGKDYAVHFPIENRWVKKDDIYLSPAYGRDSAYIACHVYCKKDNRAYFKDLEDIFKEYEGRPHWGKMHTLTTQDVQERYPKFDDFKRIQKEQDPNKIFVNPYLEKLLGI